ncbi:hypothetical protein HYN48_09185 [Flavobacterium magnum]|uniref:Uncharacterized protein n=1 Tax=Flavobacterium magnum TaxID=2162713 RepID=A0A2S0RG18_9FLAO|nr:hypothetical protein [Flavobacterium magnum]AWA30240.1 hypothetical protein HYN48_09185 [Flavobacterium magnum]
MRHIIFLIVIGIYCEGQAQRNAKDYAFINIGFHSVVAGVGAVINKKEGEKTGRTFIKGLLGGAAGGSLMYSGKLLTGNISKENTLGYAWPGKIIYSAGNSIMENAAMNRPVLSQFHMNIGIVRLGYDFTKSKINAKVLPLTTIITAYIATQSKFEAVKSLCSGEIIFSSNKFNSLDLDFRGFTVGNVVVLHSNYAQNYQTIGHEIIHTFQNNDFNFTNAWILTLADKNNFYRTTSKYLYYEFNTLLNQAAYWLQYRNDDGYYSNVFESEAAAFTHTFRNVSSGN